MTYKPLTVKIGGSLLQYDISDIISDVGETLKVYNKILIVHGGANKVDEEMKKRGLKIKKIYSPSGIESRYTYQMARDVYTEVMEGITTWLVDLLRLQNIGAYGFPPKEVPINARRKDSIIGIWCDDRGQTRRRIIRDDYSGEIKGVDANMISRYFDDNSVLVLPPIGNDPIGGSLNINGDKAAAYVAGSIGSEVIVDLTDVDGVLLKGNIIPRIEYTELGNFIKEVEVRGGMKRKLLHAKESFEIEGTKVREFIIANGLKDGPISSALKKENCTVITK